MTDPQTDVQVPEGATAEDVRAAGDVGAAAGAAAEQALQGGGSRDDVRGAVDRAVEEKLRGLQITMSEADRNAVVDQMIDRLDGLGAFQPPPAADAPEVSPETSTPEAAAEQAAQAAENQPAPRKRSLAERFAGI